MTSNTHEMPFGTEILEDDSVRFRLWAPAARKVEVCIQAQGETRCLGMAERGDGWFEQVTREARPGDL
jgi:1,4-alpha-glucan branching enzyme